MPRPRRAVLQSCTAVTVTGLAGCLGFGGTNTTVDITIRNDDTVAHELAVTIAFEGETLFEQRTALPAGESTHGSFENPNTAGSARVETTLDDTSQTTASVRIGPGTGIRYITVKITQEASVRVQAART